MKETAIKKNKKKRKVDKKKNILKERKNNAK